MQINKSIKNKLICEMKILKNCQSKLFSNKYVENKIGRYLHKKQIYLYLHQRMHNLAYTWKLTAYIANTHRIQHKFYCCVLQHYKYLLEPYLILTSVTWIEGILKC